MRLSTQSQAHFSKSLQIQKFLSHLVRGLSWPSSFEEKAVTLNKGDQDTLYTRYQS